ncbi:hypothetical protein [Nannocystis sp. SCPEA4]|uniref:hypothetical protein n=1 Tax=Nannocystis sp. SCPEA4 TaxID=2996787 RepID=UPI0022714F23|nr:hypothetical protein [Nannocystis sp. SCPEA4]MCY1060783.1 hypothetical protein [Nannocystis sp. SCPEA4]
MTGPCIQGQCLAGLQCFVDECVPGAGSNSNSNSNSNGNSDGNSDGEPEDPTTTDGTTGVSGGVTEGSATQPTTASSNDPGTTTGDPSTTSTTTNVTNVTNPMTTGVERTTGVETDTWDDSASDSQGFILPDTDTGGEDPCDAITCGVGETCAIVGEDPQCLMHCHPLDPEYCGTGNVCVQHIDVFVCAPDASGDVGAVGQGCAYTNGCDPGLACLDGQWVAGCNGQYCCTPFCDLSLADPCLAYDMQCVAWWEQGMAPQGFEDVGACVVV